MIKKANILLDVIGHLIKPYGKLELLENGYLKGLFCTEKEARYYLGYSCGYANALGWNIDWCNIKKIAKGNVWQLTIRLGKR
jgi:hypothetical protein